MRRLDELVSFSSGSPQFRITESLDRDAPRYRYYSQTDLTADLSGICSADALNKEVRTKDKVHTLAAGDVVFSLIAGQAAIVQPEHDGFLYTQNYIRLQPIAAMDAGFLVYLLNEDRAVQKQFFIGLQGSQVLKYTLQQVKGVRVARLPSLDRQRQIGELYLQQLHLTAMKKRAADWEKMVVMSKLAEAVKR